jgi:single-strand DNA-binding protein
MNKVIINGNLCADPESRTSNTGKAIANLRVAVSGRNDKTVFVDVTCFDKTAELVTKYKTKGDPVLIDGRLELDSWEDKSSGQKRSKLYVIADNVEFLSGGKGKSEDSPQPTTGSKKPTPVQNDDQDSVPF